MTKKDLFTLLIKLIGLVFLISIFNSSMIEQFRLAIAWQDWGMLIVLAGLFLLVIIFCLLLIFGAGKISTFLRLGKGFEEDRIELKGLKAPDIIKVGTFLIGGWLAVANLPGFVGHLIWWVKNDQVGIWQFSPQQKMEVFVMGAHVVIGFLLMKNYQFVARLVKVEDYENEAVTEPSDPKRGNGEEIFPEE